MIGLKDPTAYFGEGSQTYHLPPLVHSPEKRTQSSKSLAPNPSLLSLSSSSHHGSASACHLQNPIRSFGSQAGKRRSPALCFSRLDRCTSAMNPSTVLLHSAAAGSAYRSGSQLPGRKGREGKNKQIDRHRPMNRESQSRGSNQPNYLGTILPGD